MIDPVAQAGIHLRPEIVIYGGDGSLAIPRGQDQVASGPMRGTRVAGDEMPIDTTLGSIRAFAAVRSGGSRGFSSYESL
jgi:hypothetical protein